MSHSPSVLQHLEASRATLRAVIDHLSEAAQETPLQDEDQRWTARQILSHLVDAQWGMLGQRTAKSPAHHID